MTMSSRSRTPAGDVSFKRLHQKGFDCKHDGDEGESICQHARDVEQLECDTDLEANAVGAPEQLDDEYDFPDQREAGTSGGREIGRKLRHYDVTHARPGLHAKDLRHVIERTIKRARTFTYGHGRDG